MEQELLGELASRKRGKGMLFEFFLQEGIKNDFAKWGGRENLWHCGRPWQLDTSAPKSFIKNFYSTKVCFVLYPNMPTISYNHMSPNVSFYYPPSYCALRMQQFTLNCRSRNFPLLALRIGLFFCNPRCLHLAQPTPLPPSPTMPYRCPRPYVGAEGKKSKA